MTHSHSPVTGSLHPVLAVLGLSMGAALGAGIVSAAVAAQPDAAAVPSGADGADPEMVLLHAWPDTRVVGFNAGGHLLAYDGPKRVFEVHDLAVTNAPLNFWHNPDPGRFVGGAISSDGRKLATLVETGNDQSRIRFWNSATGESLGPSITWTNAGPLAFSPDGRILAGLDGEVGSIQLWDVATGGAGVRLSLAQRMEVGWFGIRFSPDGRHIAMESGFTSLLVWNVAERRRVGASLLDSMVNTISPDWRLALRVSLGAAGQPPRVQLVNFSNPDKPVPASKPFSDETADALNAAAFSADGRLMILNLQDGTLRFWDIEAGRLLDRPRVQAGRLIGLKLSPDNRLALTHEPDPSRRKPFSGGPVRVWNLETGQAFGALQSVTGFLRDKWFDPESRHLILPGPQPRNLGVQIWKLPPRTTQ